VVILTSFYCALCYAAVVAEASGQLQKRSRRPRGKRVVFLHQRPKSKGGSSYASHVFLGVFCSVAAQRGRVVAVRTRELRWRAAKVGVVAAAAARIKCYWEPCLPAETLFNRCNRVADLPLGDPTYWYTVILNGYNWHRPLLCPSVACNHILLLMYCV